MLLMMMMMIIRRRSLLISRSPLVPYFEEAVPRPRANRHAVFRDAETADAVVVTRQDACGEKKKVHNQIEEPKKKKVEKV